MTRTGLRGAAIVAALTTTAVAFTACSPTTEAGREELEQPVNCATAEDDLHILTEEKKRVSEQQVAGVTAVTPAGAVVGILSGTEEANLQVLSGEYEEQLDAKIEEIKTTCGID